MDNSIPSPSPGSRRERLRQAQKGIQDEGGLSDFSRVSRDHRLREQKMERRFVSAFLVVFGLTLCYLMARSPLSHLWP